jgi:hypothetical protein
MPILKIGFSIDHMKGTENKKMKISTGFILKLDIVNKIRKLRVAGSSQPSTQLWVAATRHSGVRDQGSFRFFGARSTAFGTSSLCMRLSSGFSSVFRSSRLVLRLHAPASFFSSSSFFFFVCFPVFMAFSLYFGFVPFRPMSARVLGLSWVLGLFVVLWQGFSGFLVGFGVCWVGIVSGLVSVVWVFDGASTVFRVLCGI